MIKSKIIYSFFFMKKTCDEDENNASTSIKLERFHDNQKLKIIKNNFLKFLELYIMNLKNYNSASLKIFSKFCNG